MYKNYTDYAVRRTIISILSCSYMVYTLYLIRLEMLPIAFLTYIHDI